MPRNNCQDPLLFSFSIHVIPKQKWPGSPLFPDVHLNQAHRAMENYVLKEQEEIFFDPEGIGLINLIM